MNGGGHEKNYQDFMDKIKDTDLEAAAKILNLEYSESGSIRIPFLGRTYNVSQNDIYIGMMVHRSKLYVGHY